MVDTILAMFISLPFMEIQWRIKTEDALATEEACVWRGDIRAYQRAFLPVNSNTLASNLDGLTLSYLLLNGWSSLIAMFTSLILALAYTPLYFKYHVL